MGASQPRVLAGALAVAACSAILAVVPVAAEPSSHPRALELAARSLGPAATDTTSRAANGPREIAPRGVDGLANRLVKSLKQRYQVGRGYPKLYTTADCEKYSYPIMKTCFANNPAAPYIFAIVPKWPREYVDPALQNAFGKTRRGHSATYRFDRREAIVGIDDTRLKGSAASYATVPNRNKLYVYYLTRKCAGLKSLTKGRCLSITTEMVPTGGSFKLTQRTYIRPGAERGPDSTKLLRPVVMKLTRP